MIVESEETGLYVDAGRCIRLSNVEFETLFSIQRNERRFLGDICAIEPIHGELRVGFRNRGIICLRMSLLRRAPERKSCEGNQANAALRLSFQPESNPCWCGINSHQSSSFQIQADVGDSLQLLIVGVLNVDSKLLAYSVDLHG